MAKRKIGQYLEVDGGLFDSDGGKRAFNDALADGIKKQGEKGVEIMQGLTARANFIDTGAFVSSIDSKFTRSSSNVVGFALVAPSAVWPKNDRPTRTWLQKGTRKGTKLRKGSDVFSQTSTRLKDASYEEIAASVAKALD